MTSIDQPLEFFHTTTYNWMHIEWSIVHSDQISSDIHDISKENASWYTEPMLHDLDSSQNSFGVQGKIKFSDRIEKIELKHVLLLTKVTTWYIGSHTLQHTCLELIMLIQQILMHTIPWSRYWKYKCAELQSDTWNCVSPQVLQVFLYGTMRNCIIEIVLVECRSDGYQCFLILSFDR